MVGQSLLVSTSCQLVFNQCRKQGGIHRHLTYNSLCSTNVANEEAYTITLLTNTMTMDGAGGNRLKNPVQFK